MKTSVYLARRLRKNQTESEKILWQQLRNRNFQNLKFKRQKPIEVRKFANEKRFYIVDFYCFEYKLVLEIDGLYHKDYEAHDLNREEELKLHGYHMIRFTNSEVKNELDSVLSRLSAFIVSLKK